MRRVLEGSDFRLEDMKERRITVYLCLPANRLATHGRWLRLMIGLTLEAMERTGPLKEGQHPVLFCLDEFAVLDHMESIEKAAGQIAGFGVKLWPVVQDLTQLQRDYKEAWETFMGNAGLMMFFGNSDLTTLEHISKRLGETEVIRTVENLTESWQRLDRGKRPGNVLRPARAGVGQHEHRRQHGRQPGVQSTSDESLAHEPGRNRPRLQPGGGAHPRLRAGYPARPGRPQPLHVFQCSG